MCVAVQIAAVPRRMLAMSAKFGPFHTTDSNGARGVSRRCRPAHGGRLLNE